MDKNTGKRKGFGEAMAQGRRRAFKEKPCPDYPLSRPLREEVRLQLIDKRFGHTRISVLQLYPPRGNGVRSHTIVVNGVEVGQGGFARSLIRFGKTFSRVMGSRNL